MSIGSLEQLASATGQVTKVRQTSAGGRGGLGPMRIKADKG